MTIQLASRIMKARRESTCPICRQAIQVGQLIAKTGFWCHASCAIERNRQTSTEGKRP